MSASPSDFRDQFDRLLIEGRFDEARVLVVRYYHTDFNSSWLSALGIVFHCMGEYRTAKQLYLRRLSHDDDGVTHTNLAHLLATCPDYWVRSSRGAVHHAIRGLCGVREDNWQAHTVCAGAYANNRQWNHALSQINEAIRLAPASSQKHLAMRLSQYEQRKPTRMTGADVARIFGETYG